MTRDGTGTPSTGSVKSQPLNPSTMFFGKLLNSSEPLECHQRNENNNRTFLSLYMCACMCACVRVCVCVCVCIKQLTAAVSPLPSMHSFNKYLFIKITGLPRWHDDKELPSNAGDARDAGLVPRLGRSTRAGNGNPFHYSCLETSMDRGAWWVSVQGVSKELD